MAIVKRIVERHGGQITAASVSGQGARFVFTLAKPGVQGSELTSTPEELNA
ncbi:MAG: hypothetical protein HC848_04595 [Limnobacter sp.]|nr:hypothetical protein [Limnobacter sp.]